MIFAFPSVWESVVSGQKEKKKKGSKLASKMVIKIFISGNSGNKEVRENTFFRKIILWKFVFFLPNCFIAPN